MAKLAAYFILAILIVSVVSENEAGPILAKVLKLKKLALFKAPLLLKKGAMLAKPLLAKPLMLAKPLIAKAAGKGLLAAKALPLKAVVAKKKLVG